MPTFLTTHKMPPALVHRIEASISGRRSEGARFGSRVTALLRFATFFGIVAAVGGFFDLRRRDDDEIERLRKSILEYVRKERASVRTEDLAAVPRAEAWLTRLSGQYDGDLVDGDLRGPGALGAVLDNPLVYVRGPLDAFKSPSGIAAAASASRKDAFLLCLLDPPPDDHESTLLQKVHVAYGGGSKMAESTRNAHGLHAAEVGLPVLGSRWAERVTKATRSRDLERYRFELESVPIAEAKEAAAAPWLLAVMDEPGELGRPSELDGERPHQVRVALVDFTARRIVLRLRKHVDPSSYSERTRTNYASGIDGCALAVDVGASVARRAVTPAAALPLP